MGRRRALAALLVAAASLGASAGELPLREARWIAPEARFEQLSSFPRLCVSESLDLLSDNSTIGFAAFRDPLLLGGQAARTGISCASCHRGGRGNAAFVFPGVSGSPGTADVTSSLLSSHRGDGKFNPAPIPDLTLDVPKISRTEPGKLEAFIRALIVEEFDGTEPPARVISGLADAVRALDPKICQAEAATGYEADMESYVYGVAAVKIALRIQDRETAIAMLRATRSAIGRIAERFAPRMSDSFAASDRELARIQQSLRDGAASTDALAEVDAYIEKAGWTGEVGPTRNRSLYDPALLKAALNAARTP